MSDGSATGFHSVAVVGERRLYFDAIPVQARLRVTIADPHEGSVVLGSVIRLDTDEPGLRVCAPIQVEWATEHNEDIVAEAVRMWGAVVHQCEG